jgi:hypothetical protein
VCYIKESYSLEVAPPFKALSGFAHTNTWVVGSNPSRIINVYVVLCVGRGLSTSSLPSKQYYRPAALVPYSNNNNNNNSLDAN